MSLIQSTMPSAASHVIRKPDATARIQPVFITVPPVAQASPDHRTTNDQVVAPAAPPSAVQLQIKALISEQVQTVVNAQQGVPADPS
ncbi:hypothetical protein [Marivita geojedonensis]|uniref:Uncharacterized protein n=1 Tax=Marivita geojedonensis TaxID=1123756 RepID=A0A1X4NIJ9_9RHOB|nr:hypothetical protein [Marivita geojedonensis]OSQ48171.1 hypothetical protein MGEO_14720 [Marivita geojedonensis]PRY74963.1 hypothetical protein CLV76_117102 [Marivita geojedonensis]